MTGFLHEKEFSRKTFLKGGGALIIGFSVLGSALAGKAGAGGAPVGPYGSSFVDPTQVDSWLVVHSDNTATIFSGAISQGTGSDTAILQIVGEELGMGMSQLSNASYDTATTPNTGSKSASNTVWGSSGRGIRAASVMAYQTLLGLASAQLGVPTAQLSVTNGVVSGGGKSVTYGQLVGGKLFNVQMPSTWNLAPSSPTASVPSSGGLAAGQTPAKPISDYKLVGTSQPRIEIPGIVTGTFAFIQNIRIPGMLHGRVVRPRGQAVHGFSDPIVSVDVNSIAHVPNVKVVRVGNFLGVVAPKEYDAIQAASQLKVTWADPPAVLPGGGDEFQALRALDSAGRTVQSYRTLTGNVDSALASAAHSVSATYAWPTNAHTPIAPQCCVADVTPQGVRVIAGTQGAYSTQTAVATALGIPVSQVRVTTAPIGGSYGPGAPYNDAAQAAALLSREVGAPVRVQFMRWDELGWLSTPPGAVYDVRAGIDSRGNLVGVDFTQFYPQYLSSGGVNKSAELAAQTATSGSSVSGVYAPTQMYSVPNDRWLLKSLPLLGNWVKCQWMRCGSTPHATWAIEQTMDDLARASGMDPVVFRRQNVVQDARGANTQADLLAVLDAVTKAANWQPKVPASQLSEGPVVSGRGVAWSDIYTTSGQTKSAAVADLRVNKKTGKVMVDHVYVALTAGLSVNPGFVENQLVGGVTQILSRLLFEQLRFGKGRTASFDFVSYPIMRFKDAPKVTAIVVQQPYETLSGIGEPVTLVASAAVANAFFDATGVRMRTAPYTPPRVRAALVAAGAA